MKTGIYKKTKRYSGMINPAMEKETRRAAFIARPFLPLLIHAR